LLVEITDLKEYASAERAAYGTSCMYNTELVKHVDYVLPSAIITLAGKIAKCKVEIPGVQIMTVNNQGARI